MAWPVTPRARRPSHTHHRGDYGAAPRLVLPDSRNTCRHPLGALKGSGGGLRELTCDAGERPPDGARMDAKPSSRHSKRHPHVQERSSRYRVHPLLSRALHAPALRPRSPDPGYDPFPNQVPLELGDRNVPASCHQQVG